MASLSVGNESCVLCSVSRVLHRRRGTETSTEPDTRRQTLLDLQELLHQVRLEPSHLQHFSESSSGGRRWTMSRIQMETRSNGASTHGATVSFHDIYYKVSQGGRCFSRKKESKDILIDLNGIMKPGLNAIMGATGSGKSSFLDVLAARKDPCGLSGEVLIDGAPQPPNFKCLSGYVVQDDVVMGTLTVRENFTFSAALRLPSSISAQDKEQKVNRVIQELGLSRVADSRVGTQLIRGISGGERKRTNIGMELIIDPPVLFLDEPTTGLDASTANSVLLLLKRMASHGRTIILSIHQPRYSIYRLFDSLTLLVTGKQVYHGPAQNVLEYFSDIGYTCEPHNNPADFFLDVINGDATAAIGHNLDEDSDSVSKSRQSIEDKLVEEYRSCQYSQQTRAELGRIVQGKQTVKMSRSRTITYSTGFLTQFRWVLKRTFQNLLLNPQTSVAQLPIFRFIQRPSRRTTVPSRFDVIGSLINISATGDSTLCAHVGASLLAR
ncbi:unnamed protein product [Pleuronectes platessa]|uniref:ABC transporter domain-containing protein n=1 Tax=Pleuronectes platessa TaxID=8262 RepID=A0A9N7U239_PLEPL|nr:unnamed protein product [Pleuronectes platessa]